VPLHRFLPACAVLAPLAVALGLARPDLRVSAFVAAVVLLALAFLSGARKSRLTVWFTLAGISALAVAHAAGATLAQRHDPLQGLDGSSAMAIGVVCAPTSASPRSERLRVRLQWLAVRRNGDWHTCRPDGAVVLAWVRPPRGTTRTFPRLAHWGQQVSLVGVLEAPRAAPPGGFDYAAWLEDRDVHHLLRVSDAQDVAVLEDSGPLSPATARRAMERAIESHLPTPHADLLRGIVLGDGGALPEHIADDFRATGTYHVVAASGLNVSLLMIFAVLLARGLRLGRFPTVLLALGMVTAYTLVAGASPSIVRAALMGGVAQIGLLLDRENDSGNALACAVILMLAWEPRQVRDVGFILSVACVLGILLLGGPIRARLARVHPLLATLTAITLATQIAVAPLSAALFGTIPLVAIVANPLVVPLCEAALAVGLALSAVGGSEPLAGPLAATAWALLEGAVRLVHFLAGVPGAVLTVPTPGPLQVALCYLAIALLWKLLRARRVSSEVAETRQGRSNEE